MIQITKKEECCGCEVCSNICPVSCIHMEADEKGFVYPQIDREKCIGCNLCESVCPVISPFPASGEPVMYAIQNKDENIRSESTSGGAFSLIADWILKREGIVIGVAFDQTFQVVHAAEGRREKIARFRGSKYVQSRTGTIYHIVKNHLKEGKWVCFSGTPCQVNALKKFLKRDYEKLVTVDLACHGITSPLFWKKYIEYHKEREGSEISDVWFREKHYGYGYSTMKIGFQNGHVYRAGMETDIMLRSFFMDLNTRESCHACRFKTIKRVSDFTLFDGWHVAEYEKRMKDDRGTTLCIAQSEKGRGIFNEIKTNCRFAEVPVSLGVELDGKMMVHSTTANEKRERFFQDIRGMSIPEIQDKYYPITMKRKILSRIKPFIYKVGIFKYYMLMKEKIGKK